MLKSNNICKTHPHMADLLETEVYERRRRTKGMSQYTLADKMGVSRTCIYQLEAHYRIPKSETVFDMIEALGFTEDEKTSFLDRYLDAYYKDKVFQQEREEVLAGAV